MSKALTIKAAVDYMIQWSHYTSIKKVDEDDEYFYFVAKCTRTNNPVQIRVERALDSEHQHNIYEREVTDDTYQWTDAMDGLDFHN